MNNKEKKLQRILDQVTDGKKVFGTSFSVNYRGWSWSGSSGNLSPESLFFIASTTKMYISCIILHFQSEGKLQLEDKISQYLDPATLKGLHMLRGVDYTGEITIRDLLAHTSGLPDYFLLKNQEGISLERQLTSGKDQQWSFDQIIGYSKSLRPRFKPGQKNKAHYSDTNYQLLGKIIENISGQSVADNLDQLIFQPLAVRNTYMYQDAKDMRPHTLYYRNKPLHIPRAMTSFGPDGGIVSTADEMLIFLQSYFKGRFFPETYIPQIRVWNRIFFPLQAGIGIHRFKLSRIFDPFGSMPEIIGHSGLSGALAYCNPEQDVYVAGTINQAAHPDIAFRVSIKLIRELLNS